MNKLIAILVIKISFIATASADTEVRVDNVKVGTYKSVHSQYLKNSKMYQGKELIDSYVHGLGNGIVAYDTFRYQIIKDRVLCFSKGQLLDSMTYKHMLDDGIVAIKPDATTPIDVVMTGVLQRDFNCKAESKKTVSEPDITGIYFKDFQHIYAEENKDIKHKQLKEKLRMYIHGLGNGIVAMNELSKFNGLKPLLCFPDNYKLKVDNYELLINKFGKVFKNGVVLEALLPISLVKEYECKK